LREKIKEWDGDEFRTVEFLEWVRNGRCPQWLQNGGVRRLVAYLKMLERLDYIVFNGGRWVRKK
jgi:hypothetical protein